jgi:hypothetical protein
MMSLPIDLNPHSILRAEEHGRPVEVRPKLDAAVGDFAQRREAEDLVSAAVGQDRSAPTHELVQTTQLAHHPGARTQRQMIRVGKHDLGTDVLVQLSRREAFYGAGSSDRHEDRRFDPAVSGRENAAAGRASRRGGNDAERACSAQLWSYARATLRQHHESNMASP